MIVTLIVCIRSLHDLYASFPYEIFIDSKLFKFVSFRELLNGESWFEQEYGYTLHHLDSIYLVTKERLLSPHAPQKKVLIFEEDWERTDKQVNTSTQGLTLTIISDCPLLYCDLMHCAYYLYCQLDM